MNDSIREWNMAREVDPDARVEMKGADLRRADLRKVNLQGANLQGASLQGASLQGANLRSADLEGADLGGANLGGACLSGANLCGACLGGADLVDTNLCKADLRRADLGGATLEGADLRGADLEGADVTGTLFGSPAMLFLAKWGACSDELTLQLMRLDAASHPDPKAFSLWAKGGDCPYGSCSFLRMACFHEKKEIWSPGRHKRIYTLVDMLLKERCVGWAG